jgi:hypothetical protein
MLQPCAEFGVRALRRCCAAASDAARAGRATRTTTRCRHFLLPFQADRVMRGFADAGLCILCYSFRLTGSCGALWTYSGGNMPRRWRCCFPECLVQSRGKCDRITEQRAEPVTGQVGGREPGIPLPVKCIAEEYRLPGFSSMGRLVILP